VAASHSQSHLTIPSRCDIAPWCTDRLLHG
jgi:hypothetical protein